MFAFAIYDRVDNSLTLVRDAFGIKPLFYHHDNNSFSFASEVLPFKFLLEKLPEINFQRLYEYLAYNTYDNAEDTFFQEIHHLLPGHVLRVELETFQVGVPQRWWHPSIENRANSNFEDAANKIREIFLDNVRLHLRSDVPIGVALSGGIDSSAIVCAIRYLEPSIPIHTFSYMDQSSLFNEKKWVDIVNKKVGAIAHEVKIKDDEIISDIDDVVRAQGEPFGNLSIYAQSRIFKAAKEAKIKVIFDGQGADEIFGGYEGYPAQVIKTIYEQKGFLPSLSFFFLWVKWPGRSIRLGIIILLQVLISKKIKKILKVFFNKFYKKDYINYNRLNAFGVKKYSSLSEKENKKEPCNRHLMKTLREELTTTRVPRLLRYADRNAMSQSIENRVPFLTTNLVEFILSLPEDYLISTSGETKFILRHALRGIVPDEILNRKDKIGFDVSNTLLQSLKTPKITDLKSVFFLKKNTLNKNKDWKIINFFKWIKLIK
jgi:asparagine synthase (glutamine-hydrolysing)